MATVFEDTSLKNIWNSLFDLSVFSACKENDVELQSVAMLLRKTFSLFEKLKVRCEDAERTRREPCPHCPALKKTISAYEEKLKQNEARVKSIAEILNLGGLSDENNTRQQSMAKALTQILLGEEGDISEDDSEPTCKRKQASDSKPCPGETKDLVLVPETLPSVPESRNATSDVANKVVLETLCSQTTTARDASENDKMYAKTTPTKQHTPTTRGKTSPIIRRKKEKERLPIKKHKQSQVDCKLEQEDETLSQDMSTSSPTIVGSKKSLFTPKLRLTRDKMNIPTVTKTSSIVSVSTSALTPNMEGKCDDTFISPSVVEQYLSGVQLSSELRSSGDQNKSAEDSRETTEIKSTGNAELDSILDLMCDTHVPNKAGVKRPADYWKLKPSACSKEPISIKGGARLVQTKIAFGVHPEKTDICTVREFNGGVRQSQTATESPDSIALKDFNAGIRPSLTSTMLPQACSEEAAFEQAILNSLVNLNTQVEDEDIIEASPEVLSARQTVYSQKNRHRPNHKLPVAGPGPSKAGADLKENVVVEKTPDAEELLDEMGVQTQHNISMRTANLIKDFDKIPRRETDEKYHGGPVRKRDERRKLEGWSCADCEGYYAAMANTSFERKQMMNRCSRHRSKFKRKGTPPGFWDPAFPSTPELRARNLDITHYEDEEFHTRRKREKT